MALSRRTVLHGVGAGVGAAGAAAWTGTAAEAAPGRPVPPPGGGVLTDGTERTVDLRDGWRFALVNTDGADAPRPDDGAGTWRDVDLPHDWSIALDPEEGDHTTSGTGFLPGGLGWYEKTLVLPRALDGKKVWAEFDGVYMDAHVYVNGEAAGEHPYGYTGFAVDLTEHLTCDGETRNTLAVKVRNQIPSSRWYSGSGIYRDVRLVVAPPVHLVRHGVTVTTPDLEQEVKRGRATVRVAATAVSEAGAAEARVTVALEDADGRTVATRTEPAALGPEERTVRLDLRVDEPRLWSLERPYRYTVVTRVRTAAGAADETRTPCGLRWFAVDPADGFSLNGTHLKLQGVNLHHDLGPLGAAFSPDAARRQLALMRRMGVNAVRTAHNPPAPGLVDLCDQEGFLLIAEAFDCWRTGKTDYDYGRFFDEHSESDIKEMVHAAKNSPAVVMWSIGNEVYDNGRPEGVAMARDLIRAVKSVDATRPVVIGAYSYRSVPEDGSPEDRILRLLDGIGVNYNTAGSLDDLHAKYPGTFFFESESSSNTSTRGVYDAPDRLNTGENHAPGRRGASSYDNNQAPWTMSGEHSLKKDRDRKFLTGQFLWTGIDYIGEPTPYDVFPVKTSFFGAVDTAGFPKDQFHLFRSQWSDEPMVHLVPMDWTRHRPGEEVTVWAYSNAESVELFLNGRSLGERRFDRKTTGYGRGYLETTEATGDDKTVTDGPYPGSYTSPNGSAGKLHLTWKVPFRKGRLQAVARHRGKVVARDTLRTAGRPALLRLRADRKRVTADGRALVFVTAEVTDARGVTVPGADTPVAFSVSGATLAGTDNGRQESAENYLSATRAAFQGRALAVIRAGREPGAVTVTARAPGLHPDTVRIRATAAGRAAGTADTAAARTAPAPLAAPASPRAGDRRGPRADAGYAGAPDSLPAAMLDGSTATGWSNFFRKEATPLLPEESTAHARAWVSLSWDEEQRIGALEASFTQDAAHALPEAVAVSSWNGRAWVPVDRLRTDWADASDAVTRLTFEPVTTRRVKLELTSRHPGTDQGFLRIVRLAAAGE
ncbi:glycoside hydrolase family 2 TIM barrel-domain containing protein [Streptomyces boncukensis]|uniref:Glycoside hydrolase family 2 protein n=1 Tax=Streptomyces boncukensis TaxID=2711219 RepID=A0A6G4WR47_9ACTN|nr:glycoside hydrolase family 2 TIM barrel-domain containing protein [Streptomyces boncukensis]NGO67675.1 glycoside hydrolase family 2 protein [Streptomyces boncukensis]